MVHEKIINSVEEVIIISPRGEFKTKARIDTGAYRTSVDKDFVLSLGLKILDNKVMVRSASGRQERSLCELEFELKGVKIKTISSVSERKHMKYKMIIGRKDLKNFLVKP